MTISKELMYALLAMDSYNRGYDQGVAGLGGAGSKIGSAILQVSPNSISLTDWQAAGFYAASYTFNGETVISYRGTDNYNPFASGNDIVNGWISALGATTSQTNMALDFYNAVTHKTYQDGAQANFTLTGHSLGGGLAGFVAALSGTDAVIFDHMPFGALALAQFAKDHPNFDSNLTLTDVLKLKQITGYSTLDEILQSARNGGIQLTLGFLLGAIPGIGPYLTAFGINAANFSITGLPRPNRSMLISSSRPLNTKWIIPSVAMTLW
jgi:hypothetical protein